MYLVTDSYGTRRAAWTYRQALDWLRYCSPNAAVFNRFTGRLIAVRNFTKA